MVEEDKSPRGGVRDACPICLEPISGEAYLDQCFHRFCYHCILQWSEMLISKPQSTSNRLQCLKCPLCKQSNVCVEGSSCRRCCGCCILTVECKDAEDNYFDLLFWQSSLLKAASLPYQKLDGHVQREAVYASEVEQKLSRFTNSVPKPNRWLSIWVQRELQALMQEEDVQTVMQHVVGVVEAFNKRVGEKGRLSAEGGTISKDLDWHTTIATAVQPFIFEHAEKFAEELRAFLLSGLDIVAYDQQNKLRASVAERLTLTEGNVKEIPRNKTFDLYDEDFDDDGVDVMVARSFEAEIRPSLSSEEPTDSLVIVGRSTEAECPPRGDTAEDIAHYTREEDIQAQTHRHSRRRTLEGKDKKKHVNPAGHSIECSDSTSRHGRDVRRSRKRGRSRPSPNAGQS